MARKGNPRKFSLFFYSLFDFSFLDWFFKKSLFAFLCRILGSCFGLSGVALFLLNLSLRALSVAPSTRLAEVFFELFGRSPSEPPQSPLPSPDTAEPAGEPGEEQPPLRPHEITQEPYYRLVEVERRLDSLLEGRPSRAEDLAAWGRELHSVSAEMTRAIDRLGQAMEEERRLLSSSEQAYAHEVSPRLEQFRQAQEERRAWLLSKFPAEAVEQYERDRLREMRRLQGRQ